MIRSADVRVTTTDFCRDLESKDRVFTQFHEAYSFCAGGGGNDTCTGDSGGPLFCSIGQKDVLMGITSQGPKRCGKLPGIYTKVSALIPWIKNHTSGTKIDLMSKFL